MYATSETVHTAVSYTHLNKLQNTLLSYQHLNNWYWYNTLDTWTVTEKWSEVYLLQYKKSKLYDVHTYTENDGCAERMKFWVSVPICN